MTLLNGPLLMSFADIRYKPLFIYLFIVVEMDCPFKNTSLVLSSSYGSTKLGHRLGRLTRDTKGFAVISSQVVRLGLNNRYQASPLTNKI